MLTSGIISTKKICDIPNSNSMLYCKISTITPDEGQSISSCSDNNMEGGGGN